MLPSLEALQKNLDMTTELGFVKGKVDIAKHVDLPSSRPPRVSSRLVAAPAIHSKCQQSGIQRPRQRRSFQPLARDDARRRMTRSSHLDGLTDFVLARLKVFAVQ
jgi:hypothetical protein